MKRHIMFIIIFAGIVIILIGVFFLWHLVFSKAPNPPLRTGQISIGKNVFAVELATTTIEQARGLSFRTSLAERTGMLFTFSPGVQNFWMKDMHFPIDIIWIAGNKVAGFAENAQPEPGMPLWRLTIYTSPDGVDKVLEVNANTVTKDDITIGSPVIIGPSTE
jgi:uncharacterized membrane protein (UPF0127 family)